MSYKEQLLKVVAQSKMPIELSDGIRLRALEIEEERLWFILETPNGMRHTKGPVSSFYGCRTPRKIVLRALEYGSEAEDAIS